MEIITDIPLRIDEREVLRLQGYRGSSAQPSERIRPILDEALALGYRLAKPAACRVWVEVDSLSRARLVLGGGQQLSVGSGLRHWRGATRLGIAVCTIGKELEEEIDRLFGGNELPLAFMLDSVGSVAVESAAHHMHGLLCGEAKDEGLAAGLRLSPGYGDWKVQEQETLFGLLPAGLIDVRLNDHSMMIPRKSISFCVGAGRDVVTPRSRIACHFCTMGTCAYRIGRSPRTASTPG